MKILKTTEELYIQKVRGFLFGLKHKSKSIGEIDMDRFLTKIAKTNPNMAIELQNEYDKYLPKEEIILW